MRSKTQNEREQESRIYADVFNNIPVGLHIYRLERIDDDSSLRMIYANSAAEDYTSVPVKEVVGKTLDENFPGLREMGIPRAYAEVVRTGKAKELGDVCYKDERVPERCFKVRAFPLPDNCVGISFTDITQRKQTEEALKESEGRFRTIIENAPFGYYRIGKDGLWQYVNKEWERMHGLKMEEVVGKSFEITQSENSVEQARESVQRVFSGEAMAGEFDRIRSDGSRELHTFNIQPVYQRGEIVAIEGFINDITERKQAEEELRESEEKLRQVVQNMPVMLDAFDEKRNIIVWNTECEQVTGYTAEEIIGNPNAAALLYPDAGYQEYLKDMLAKYGGTFRNLEWDITHKDGSKKTVMWSNMSELFPIPGWFSWAIGVDITERKRMEEDLRRAHNLESLGVLAGGIAHDFNNVLTGVMGNLALLERLLDKDSMEHEIASEARQAASKTKGLTQQLMTFAQGGAPVKEIASIEELIRETTNLSLHGANTKPEFHFADDLFSVDIDTAQISQVIQNLVINADQAMPNGGMLRISAENAEVLGEAHVPLAPGKYVKATVQDQGVGIPKNLLSQVFDPYFSTKPKGHGLGLSICYSIIRRHSGHMAVSSQQGVGTTFTFYVPASEMPVETTMEPEKAISAGSGRVLLMDDEETICRVVGMSLKLFGYQVESASDGNEAIQKYQQAMGSKKPFDLVIMDLTIPGGMGGREAIGKLLEIDPRARVLVSSGYSHDPVMANFSQYGFAGRVAKLVDIEELADTVKRILEKREGAAEQ